MRYQFTYQNTARDLWQLSMYYIYGSLVGLCNMIFTVAMVLLALLRWQEMALWMRACVVVGMSLFTLFQPLAVYVKARKQAAGVSGETTVQFADAGIYIRSGGQHGELAWKQIRKISKKPTMLVVFADTTHGFLLPDRVLGAEKEEFYRYVVSKIKR